MSTDILNLDDLTEDPNAKILKLDGEEHRAEEMTVEAYINRVKRSKRVNPDAPMDEQIEETIVLLTEVFPTLSPKRLRSMKLSQLGRIVEFALAAPKDLAKRAEEQATSGNG